MLTTGQIAEKLKVTRPEVSYAIEKLNINHVSTAGIARLFADDVVKPIRDFLKNKRKRATGDSQ
jgi:hypothetical protein